jgi:hypothetical protein
VGADYRIYLYDFEDKICAAYSFQAGDDVEAIEVGAVVSRSTIDVCLRHEIWSEARHLTGSIPVSPSATPTLEALSEKRQAQVVELEERLASTFACIRASRALMKATDTLLELRRVHIGARSTDQTAL